MLHDRSGIARSYQGISVQGDDQRVSIGKIEKREQQIVPQFARQPYPAILERQLQSRRGGIDDAQLERERISARLEKVQRVKIILFLCDSCVQSVVNDKDHCQSGLRQTAVSRE